MIVTKLNVLIFFRKVRARSESGTTAVNNYYTPGKNCRPLSCDTTVLSGDSVKHTNSVEKVTQSDLIIVEPEKCHGATSERVTKPKQKREEVPRASKLRSRLSFLSSSPLRKKSRVRG